MKCDDDDDDGVVVAVVMASSKSNLLSTTTTISIHGPCRHLHGWSDQKISVSHLSPPPHGRRRRSSPLPSKIFVLKSLICGWWSCLILFSAKAYAFFGVGKANTSSQTSHFGEFVVALCLRGFTQRTAYATLSVVVYWMDFIAKK